MVREVVQRLISPPAAAKTWELLLPVDLDLSEEQIMNLKAVYKMHKQWLEE